MKKIAKYIAHYKDSVQISPDDYDVTIEMLECDEDTTLKEVMAWANKKYKDRRTVTITQPEDLKEKDDDMPF